jgi:membrane protease YdiL (CAAX protease family)
VLSAKPWKPDAIVRLLLSIFICIYAGSLVTTAVQYTQSGSKPGIKVFLLSGLAMVFLVTTLFLTRRPWALESFVRRVIMILGFLYAGLLLGGWAQKIAGPAATSVSQMIIGTLSFQGATLILVGRFLREHHISWTEAFGFSDHWRQALILGMLAALIFLPVGQILQQGSIAAMERFQVSSEEQQAVHALRTTRTWLDQVSLAAVAILLVPAAEEILFRGILYPAIRQAGFPKLALWVTSLIFAAVHANLAIFVPLLVLALILALLYEKTNNLLVTITAHSLFNALNFARFFWLEHSGHMG